MVNRDWFIENSTIIVNGYGFLFNERGNILCVDLNSDQRSEFAYPSLELLSTTMDNVNLDIATDLIQRNLKFMEVKDA